MIQITGHWNTIYKYFHDIAEDHECSLFLSINVCYGWVRYLLLVVFESFDLRFLQVELVIDQHCIFSYFLSLPQFCFLFNSITDIYIYLWKDDSILLPKIWLQDVANTNKCDKIPSSKKLIATCFLILHKFPPQLKLTTTIY